MTACWRHGILLHSSCPRCSLPFQRKNQLLEAPWLPCAQCSHELGCDDVVQPASKNEVDYAVFVRDLLNAKVAPVAPDLLAQLYRQRIQQIGFVRGQPHGDKKDNATSRHIRSTSMKAFTKAFIEFLGSDFIARVDPAYATGRTTNWLRFTMVDGVIDMPLQRHILLCLRLFGTTAHFMQAIKSAGQQAPTPCAAPDRDDEQVNVGIRDQHRQRIAREIRIDPTITLEGLWRKAYRPTAWLFEHDKAWLTSALTSSAQDEPKPEVATAADLLRDREFAEKVEKYARQLVAKHGKPSRITMQKLLDHLPLSYSHFKARPHKWPKLNEALSRHKETSWSLSARRILWAVDDVQRLGLTLTAGNIIARTAVSHYVLQKICQFARWELEILARQTIHIPVELAHAGIGLTWQGPQSGAWAEIGGRAYVSTSTRTVNKHVALLRSAGITQPPSQEKPTASMQPEQQEDRHARTTL